MDDPRRYWRYLYYTCTNCDQKFESLQAFFNHIMGGCGRPRGVVAQPATETNQEVLNINTSTEESLRVLLEQLALRNRLLSEQLESEMEAKRDALELFFRTSHEVQNTADIYIASKQQREEAAKRLSIRDQTRSTISEAQLLSSGIREQVTPEFLVAVESEMNALSKTRAAIANHLRAGDQAYDAVEKEADTVVTARKCFPQLSKIFNLNEQKNFLLNIQKIMTSNLRTLITLRQDLTECRSVMTDIRHSEESLANEIVKYKTDGAVTTSTVQGAPAIGCSRKLF